MSAPWSAAEDVVLSRFAQVWTTTEPLAFKRRLALAGFARTVPEIRNRLRELKLAPAVFQTPQTPTPPVVQTGGVDFHQ